STRIHLDDEGTTRTVEVPVLADAIDMSASHPPAHTHRYGPIVLGAAGAAAIGVGLVYGELRFARRSEGKQHRVPDGPRLACDPTGLALSHRATVDATVSTLAIGGGLAAVASGIVWYFVTRRDIAIVPSVGPDGVTVSYIVAL